MYTDLRERFDAVRLAAQEQQALSAYIDELREEIDSVKAYSVGLLDVAKQEFAKFVDQTELTQEEGVYVPSIEKISGDMVLLGVGADRLWGVLNNEEHLFKSANAAGKRRCEWCDREISYPAVNLAPLVSEEERNSLPEV